MRSTASQRRKRWCDWLFLGPLFISLAWTVLNLANIAITRTILRNVEGYRKETFLVKNVIWDDSPTFGSGELVGNDVTYRADGTVNGTPERLHLGQYLPRFASMPRTQSEAERYAKPGDTLTVYYNPHLTSTALGTDTPRVIKHDPTFPDNVRKRYRRLLLCGPGVLLAVFGVWFGREVWKGMQEGRQTPQPATPPYSEPAARSPQR